MHDIIVSIDKDGRFVFVNDAAVEFWDEPKENILGSSFTDYLYPDDLEKSMKALEGLIKNKNQVKGFIIKTKSHKGFRTVAWNGIAIFDDNGNYVGAQATGKDLTDILHAEEKLQALEYIVNENIYRRVFDIFGVVPVVLGPLASFRKKSLKEIVFMIVIL